MQSSANEIVKQATKPSIFMSTYKKQFFSLPSSLMYYIAKNPTKPVVYEKMIQTCKFFFVMNPILVISSLGYVKKRWEILDNNNHDVLNLKRICAKVWLSQKLTIWEKFPVISTGISFMLSKIYKCDLLILAIFDQIVPLNEFMMLAKNVPRIELHSAVVKDFNGKILMYENLYEALPKCEKLFCGMNSIEPMVNFNTFKELLKVDHFHQLKSASMYNLNGDFDIESFYNFMKKNKIIKFYIAFGPGIHEALKNYIDFIVNDILSTENVDYMPPCITYAGMNQSILSNLRHRYYSVVSVK